MALPSYAEPVSASALAALLEEQGRHIERDRLPKNFGAGSFTKCLRQAGYGMAGMVPPHPIYKLEWDLAKAVGIGVHDRLEDILRHTDEEDAAYSVVAIEEWCGREDIFFGGYIDGVVRFAQPLPALGVQAGLCILEFKTMESKYLSRGYKWFEEKVLPYFAQAQAYMHLYEHASGEVASQALVALFNRDTPKDMRVFRLTHDPNFMNDHIDDRLVPAAAARYANALPAGEPGRDCNLCGYRKICPTSVATDKDEDDE